MMSEGSNMVEPTIAIRSGELAGGLRYREAGAGTPVLCLGGGERLSPMRERLVARHRVIELLTPALPVPAIDQTITALGLERFDLIAHGAHATLALPLALERPKDVRALVLLAPTMLTLDGRCADDAHAAIVNRLSELKLPMLACFGTRDAIAPVETARHYRSHMPGCNLMLVYDSGHDMEIERPEAIASLVLDFLERHDLFLVRRESDLIFP
jgi:pimeloyl-ACP methyl ester carboxylesterase